MRGDARTALLVVLVALLLWLVGVHPLLILTVLLLLALVVGLL